MGVEEARIAFHKHYVIPAKLRLNDFNFTRHD